MSRLTFSVRRACALAAVAALVTSQRLVPLRDLLRPAVDTATFVHRALAQQVSPTQTLVGLSGELNQIVRNG